ALPIPYDAGPNSRESAARPAGSRVAAAAAAHPSGGHVVHVVVVIRARPVGRLQRLREGAEELIAQLHGRDLERVFEGPVIIGRVLALAGPQEERDELHPDGRLEFGVALGALDSGHDIALALVLAFALSFSRDGGERGYRALGGANPPRRAGGRRSDRRGLGHQAGPECGQIVLPRRLGNRRRTWRGGRRLVGRERLALLRHWHRWHRKA